MYIAGLASKWRMMNFGTKLYRGFLAMNFLLPSTPPPVLLSNHLEPSNQKSLIIKALSYQHFLQQTHNNAQQGICNLNHSAEPLKILLNLTTWNLSEKPKEAEKKSKRKMKNKKKASYRMY